MSTDHAFAELGLAPDATEREVKAAWRRLASQWHPDRNDSVDAIARMQRINQAFEQIRRAGSGARADTDVGTPGGAGEGASADFDADRPGSASSASGTRAQRPPLHRKVRMTLEEAAAGCIKVLRGKVTGVCATCAGVGHQCPGGNCASCGGSGAMRKRSFFGWPTGATEECEDCLGGGIARRPCPACDGSGRMAPRGYKLNVRIPQGMRHGDLLHVDARHVHVGGPPADIEIRVEVSEHPFFKLGDDGTIRCEMPVDGFAWIANRQIRVPTVAGFQTLQLNRERLSYRLKGHGFQVPSQSLRGDHLVTLTPIFPPRLSTDQQILLDQLSATGSGADGEALDDRLRAWNRELRAWELGR